MLFFNVTQSAVGGAVDLKACEKMTNIQKRSSCFEAVARQKNSDGASSDESFKELTKSLKNFLVTDFKDPSSPQFRNVVLRQSSDKISFHLCGEVNGKNSYGGYIGFRRFVVSYRTDKKIDTHSQVEPGSGSGDAYAKFDSDLFVVGWSPCKEGSPHNVVFRDGI
jgi:hypothetical protein